MATSKLDNPIKLGSHLLAQTKDGMLTSATAVFDESRDQSVQETLDSIGTTAPDKVFHIHAPATTNISTYFFAKWSNYDEDPDNGYINYHMARKIKARVTSIDGPGNYPMVYECTFVICSNKYLTIYNGKAGYCYVLEGSTGTRSAIGEYQNSFYDELGVYWSHYSYKEKKGHSFLGFTCSCRNNNSSSLKERDITVEFWDLGIFYNEGPDHNFEWLDGLEHVGDEEYPNYVARMSDMPRAEGGVYDLESKNNKKTVFPEVVDPNDRDSYPTLAAVEERIKKLFSKPLASPYYYYGGENFSYATLIENYDYLVYANKELELRLPTDNVNGNSIIILYIVSDNKHWTLKDNGVVIDEGYADKKIELVYCVDKWVIIEPGMSSDDRITITID